MRVYKFLDAKYGLDSIQRRRLKQSRVSDLNDPFELRPYDVADIVFRKTFQQTAEDVDKDTGMLCFSADWKSPVTWAHYSDKHKGLCLGFEIPDLTKDPTSDTGHVAYVPKLSTCPSLENLENMPDVERYKNFVRKVLFTKFQHWEYEKEVRVWCPLANEESGLHFVPFSKDLQLTEVIIGQKSQVSRGVF
jgi:hypothetical protein